MASPTPARRSAWATTGAVSSTFILPRPRMPTGEARDGHPPARSRRRSGRRWPVGTMLGRELTRAGLQVVGLERGEPRATVPDFQGPAMHDELRYSIRKGLMMDTAKETFTFRNAASETALPLRRIQSFLPGTGVGGSAVHWNGQTYRFHDADFRMRTHAGERYGKDFLGPDYSFQDWGVSYAEIEPYYDRFEYLLGISGKAGNLQGKK